jgi:IS1 family transposase
VWRYVYRAVDQHRQVIDVYLSARRDGYAARRFFIRALTTLKVRPTEVVTDAAPVYPRVLEELVPAAWHHVDQYENNRIEADHSRLKHRLRPMRGLRMDSTAAAHRRAGVHAEPTPRPIRTSHRYPHTRCASPPPSPNSPRRSDRSSATASRRPPISECNRAPRRGESSAVAAGDGHPANLSPGGRRSGMAVLSTV